MQTARIIWFTFLGSIVVIAAAQAFSKESVPKQKARIVDTEQMIFRSGGTIEIRDSFGDVRVDGWDLPEVELTVIKSTEKEYSTIDMALGVSELDRVLVGTERPTDDHLIITTSLLGRKSNRPLGAKSNVAVEYRIRAPRQIKLLIRHDAGDVHVNDIAGDMSVTTNIGEISLLLPANTRYAVDAKAESGDVCSELRKPEGPAYAVRLRAGVGDITVHTLPPVTETTVD